MCLLCDVEVKSIATLCMWFMFCLLMNRSSLQKGMVNFNFTHWKFHEWFCVPISMTSVFLTYNLVILVLYRGDCYWNLSIKNAKQRTLVGVIKTRDTFFSRNFKCLFVCFQFIENLFVMNNIISENPRC